jgi:hypothetical protein
MSWGKRYHSLFFMIVLTISENIMQTAGESAYSSSPAWLVTSILPPQEKGFPVGAKPGGRKSGGSIEELSTPLRREHSKTYHKPLRCLDIHSPQGTRLMGCTVDLSPGDLFFKNRKTRSA